MTRKKTKNLPKMALLMIVKNEHHIICEALSSILPYIDYYVISDTGSTDGTQDIIKSFFQSHNIDGVLFQDEWQDFGTNRSLVLEHARGRCQYGWMLDADDLVRVSKDIPTKQELYRLIHPQYDCFQVAIVDEADTVFYWRTQIFNLKSGWKYEGVLHEHPRLIIPRKTYPPENMFRIHIEVVSRRLGARNKMDAISKYKNDAEILLKGLEKEPFNTRYMFYLAQSYRDCQEYEKSVDWYQKRIDFGGWYEEVYYSHYMIGKLCLFYLNRETDGIRHSIKGFQVRPERIESIHSIVHYYKYHKKFELAYLYLQKIINVPFPKEDGLFLENELYEFSVKFEEILLSFLTFRPLNLELLAFLQREKNTQFFNDLHLLQTYPSLCVGNEIIFPKEFIPSNPNPLKPEVSQYRVFNPSISKNDSNELWVNIRCSNFDDNYLTTDVDGKIRTENYLCRLENTLSSIYKLVDESTFFKTYRSESKSRILGYEDIRLFHYHSNWCFLANNDEITGHIDSPQMVFGRLAKTPRNEKEWVIEYVKHLTFPYQQKIEKNWVPMIYNDTTKLDIVYSTQPLIILTPDLVTGLCLVKTQYDWFPKIPFPTHGYTIRNSSPYIQFEDGWLGLCHVVYFIQESYHQRLYYNLFVYFSNTFDCVKTSNFFHFDHHIIEFVNGITKKDDDTIIVSFSLSDRIPKIVTFTSTEIKQQLIYSH